MRHLGLDIFESGHERVHRRERGWHEHPDLFALRSERLGKGETAAQRVAVGVLVAEDEDLLVGVDQLFDLVVDVRVVALGGGYWFVPSGKTSLRSSEM
jgi:hypothetical protein